MIANTSEHGAVIARAYGLSGRQPEAVIGLSLPPEIAAAARGAPYPEDEGPARLLFVGRAEARKGFDALLAAVAILAEEARRGAVPAFVLDLVGVPATDLPADIPEAARACIRARGRVPAEDLAHAYAEAHAVLAPSRYESFGLVYQEALAYGRPVVACAQDASARRFVGGPGAGPLAKEATGPALADALRPLLADPALRALIGPTHWRRLAASAGRCSPERPSTSMLGPSRRPRPTGQRGLTPGRAAAARPPPRDVRVPGPGSRSAVSEPGHGPGSDGARSPRAGR